MIDLLDISYTQESSVLTEGEIRVGSHVVFALIHCTDVRIHCTDILIECR